MKSMLFAAAMVLTFAVSSAGAAPTSTLGKPAVSDPASTYCPCVIYWAGRYWCVLCD